MDSKITAQFETRRDAEIAVEHLVQAHGIERTDIFIRARGEANSAGVKAAGADVESGHEDNGHRGTPELAGLIEVSVDYRGDNADALQKELKELGRSR